MRPNDSSWSRSWAVGVDRSPCTRHWRQGADAVLIPELWVTIEDPPTTQKERGLGKTSWIVIVAESATVGGVHKLQQEIAERRSPFDTRILVLGHLQRGGAPAVRDRTWPVGWGPVQ